MMPLAKASYEVPVIKGADKPLIRQLVDFATFVHGNNGIGDVEIPFSTQKPLDEKADDFIIRKANELDNELILVTLGRLTNIAHALMKDPTLFRKIKHVYIMGGTIHAPGNVTPVAEANIWGDPEAAHLVFDSGLPITMVGLDVTMKTHINQYHLDLLQRNCKEENREIVNFIENSLQFYFNFYQKSNYFFGSAPLHDPLTMLVAIDPSMVVTKQMKVMVECESKYCEGMIIADLRRNPLIGKPVNVCIAVDADIAVNKILSVFV